MCAPFSIPRSAVIKCIPKPAPPPAAGIKCIYYQDTRSARRLAIPAAGLRFSRHKVHTLGRPVSRHKVHIFTTPLFPLLFYICFLFLQKVHILAGHRCSRQGKRKSAYTRRTPGAEQQPAKSAYTRQPRFVYKKYAYKAAADCEKVHTLGRHHKDNRSRQKVYTLGSPGFFTKSMHTRQPQIAKKCIH